MAHWLIKSEPSAWSWDDQVKAGAKGTHWDGVHNHTAKLNLMKMKKGDEVFFYHSNEGLEIVGIVEVIKEHYPDPKTPGEPWVLVDFKAGKPLPKPVTLKEIKATPKLAKMSLVTSFRLSVQPVTDEEWKLVCKMGGL
ncbi:EVE domain-containing protein [Terrarubrum flagellatum]|uniref:EVE domain-containing protein n=1 Tax=Terrirubrum flagellatum TaxID=2895980 RepID=UPI003144FD9B